LAATPAHADGSTPTAIGSTPAGQHGVQISKQIIVTAQKRTQNIQEHPDRCQRTGQVYTLKSLAIQV